MTAIKNSIFCEKKGRYRIAFKTRDKADYFISHYDVFVNGDIEFKPTRSFYCASCNMWHITHYPITPETYSTEERDLKIQRLQLIVEELENDFRIKDWKIWEPIIKEGLEILNLFKEKEGFLKLVFSTGRILRYRASIVATCKAKEDGSADEDFKRMRKEIERCARSLDFDGFSMAVKEMTEYFSQICYQKALKPYHQTWLEGLRTYLGNDESINLINQVMQYADETIFDPRLTTTEEIYERVLSMTLWMDKLLAYGLPRTIWDLLQSKVKKIANVLENSFNEQDPESGLTPMQKIRFIASEQQLIETSICINRGNYELALSMLHHIDEQIGKIPFSIQKIALMKELCRIGEKLHGLTAQNYNLGTLSEELKTTFE